MILEGAVFVFYSFVCFSLFVSHMRTDTKKKKHEEKYENISVRCG